MKVKLYPHTFTLFVLLYLLAAGGLFASGSKEHAPVVLINEQGYSEAIMGNVELKWKVEGSNLLIDIKAPTTGWVAIGFEPQFWMRGANLIIGYVKDSQVYIDDDYGTANTAHRHDTALGGKDNILDKDGLEQNGVTNLRFAIPLDSGDMYDKLLKQGEEYTVLVAYGANGDDDTSTHHAYRGSLKIRL